MPSAQLKIINPLGLHARAASKFVDVAKNFGADIYVTNDKGETADGKRIMNLLLLGAPVGSGIRLSAEGEDAADALIALSDLINAGFHELDD